MLNHLKPTLKLLRNRIFRCAAACPLGAHITDCCKVLECRLQDLPAIHPPCRKDQARYRFPVVSN